VNTTHQHYNIIKTPKVFRRLSSNKKLGIRQAQNTGCVTSGNQLHHVLRTDSPLQAEQQEDNITLDEQRHRGDKTSITQATLLAHLLYASPAWPRPAPDSYKWMKEAS